jgi:DNA-directed RNA polymerase specialized sigma24 family protein
MVKDRVALMAGIPEEAIEVSVIPNLPQRDAELIAAVRAASQEAAHAAERTSQLSRQAVAQLRLEGMTVRDVGDLLGVSPKRVSQLVETGVAASEAAGRAQQR